MVNEQKSELRFRDILFRKLFRERERAIELCNAVAGTNFPKANSNVTVPNEKTRAVADMTKARY